MRDWLRALLLRLHLLPALNGRLHDRVLEGARIRAGDRVADVSGGSLTLGTVERVGPDGEVLAIAVSVDALEELRANTTAPNVSYFVGCAGVLPLMDESVDVVVTHKTEAASESFRVLRSGGRISMYAEPDDLMPNFEQVFTGAGFTDVRTYPAGAYLTAVKP